MKPAVVVDIETSGTPFSGRVLTVSWQEVGEAHAHVAWAEDVPQAVWDMFSDTDRPFISHTKYDARFLRLSGHEVTGPFYDTQVMAWVDNENQSLALAQLVRRYCHEEMDKRLKVVAGDVYFLTDPETPCTSCDGTNDECETCDGEGHLPDKVHMTSAPPEQLFAYNARDVEATTELFQTLWERLYDGDWLQYFLEEEVPFTEVLLDAECAGLPIDLERSETFREELEVRHTEMYDKLLADAGLPPGFNANSGDQLCAYLFYPVFELTDALAIEPGIYNGLKAPQKVVQAQEVAPSNFTVGTVGRRYVHGTWTLHGRDIEPGRKVDSGSRFSTSSPALLTNLEAVADPWVRDLLAYRKVDKALTTYLRRFPVLAVDSRLYGRFNQTGTKTGRLSSSEPNLQNIPAHGDLGPRIRDLFRPSPGHQLLVGDYSQLEPRLMAHLSQDPVLLKVYRTGEDIYCNLAEAIFGYEVTKTMLEREVGKTGVLAMGYGAGASMVAQILSINGYPTTKAEADGYLQELHDYLEVFFDFRNHVIARVHAQGYVQTIGGRHRRLKAQFADRRNWKNVGYGERQAVNAVVQGSAGDIVRRVMVACAKRYEGTPLKLLAQVHDELLWEVPDWFLSHEPMLLMDLQQTAESAHGFALTVPLRFEPALGESWYAAKAGHLLVLPDGMNEESVDFEEERD